MKKLISILLAVLCMIGVLAGCGGGSNQIPEDDGSEVELVYAIKWAMQEDTNRVEDKINERLKELLPNTKISLMCDSAMADKWTLWMSGKIQIDIAHSGLATVIPDEVAKKSYIALNDLIDEYAPTIKKERDELYTDLYYTGMVNGDLYAIPTVQYFINDNREIRWETDVYKGIIDPAKIKEITHASPKTTEEIYKYLDSVFAAAKKAGRNPSFDAIKAWNANIAGRGYTFVGGSNSNLCYDNTKDEVKIIDFHTTEEYKTYIKWMQKWYKDGYIAKDIATNASATGNLGIYFGSNYGTDENFFDGTGKITGGERVVVDNPEFKVRASYDVGNISTYTSIPTTSVNPVRALKFIELLRTEKGVEIANLLCYGIEGEHYEKVDDKVIKAFEYKRQGSYTVSYGIPQWMVGNNLIMYLCDPVDEELLQYGIDYYKEVATSTRKHALYGYGFTTKNVTLDFSNVAAINLEYEPQLAYGIMADYEQGLKTLNDRNKAAGLQNIIDDFQKQADDYIASKK